MKKDDIYASQLANVTDFSFDAGVVEVFPDMIQRSVPGYATIVSTVGKIAERYFQPDTNIYDLGCSLGAATLSIRRALNGQQGQIIAVDNSEAMVNRCRLHVDAFKSSIPADIQLGDIRDIPMENASVVVLNFTLQFLPPDDRTALIQRIQQALVPGGVLILSEKFNHGSDFMNEALIDLHHDFKRANGYSELEISQKRTALV